MKKSAYRQVLASVLAGLLFTLGLGTAQAAEPARASTRSAAELAAQNGKLDADSVAIAEQILSSNYCEGLRPAAPEDPRARPNSY